MKAVVFHGVGDIRLDDVAEPKIQDANDAIVGLTSSAICGTDLHFIRGTVAGMRPGTISTARRPRSKLHSRDCTRPTATFGAPRPKPSPRGSSPGCVPGPS